jgi:hypothetical protein
MMDDINVSKVLLQVGLEAVEDIPDDEKEVIEEDLDKQSRWQEWREERSQSKCMLKFNQQHMIGTVASG